MLVLSVFFLGNFDGVFGIWFILNVICNGDGVLMGYPEMGKTTSRRRFGGYMTELCKVFGDGRPIETTGKNKGKRRGQKVELVIFSLISHFAYFPTSHRGSPSKCALIAMPAHCLHPPKSA